MLTTPNADCQLSGGAAPIAVFADEDGVTTFFAAPLAATAAVHVFTLDCTGPDGATTSYPIDLSSAATFAPLDAAQLPARSNAIMRPALSGDPASYADAYLVQNGYGLRPDATRDPAGYAAWLAQASQPAKLLSLRPGRSAGTFTAYPTTDTEWGGVVLESYVQYVASAANFSLPYVSYHSSWPNAEGAIWTGVGGVYESGLIQDGIVFYTSGPFLGRSAWIQYVAARERVRTSRVPCPLPPTSETLSAVRRGLATAPATSMQTAGTAASGWSTRRRTRFRW